MRAQADVALVAEDRAGEREQRALEVGERDVLVDGEALDLVELRRVGGVVVAPVAGARDHDVERRRVLHRAHLHRRRVGAQDDVVVDVERVRPLPRGVRDVVVEPVEVVGDRLDLGPLDDAEAEPDEDVLELAPRLGQQVQAPDRLRGGAGERDVDDVGGEPRVELGAVELGLARLERRLDAAPRLVGRLADAPALLRRQLRDAAQQLGSSALRPRYSMRTRSSSSEEPARSTACAAASSICWMRSIIARPRTLPPSRPWPR